jgi:UDP-glucose 4-epimerase
MILITGGLGFIGSHTTRALLDLGEECVLAQRREPGPTPLFAAELGTRVHLERADVADLDALLAIGSRHPITGVVHLSGAYFGDPLADARADVNGLLNVVEAAVRWGVRRVVIASTIGVYDAGTAGSIRTAGTVEEAGDVGPLREEMPLPMSAHHAIAASKKVNEVLVSHLGAAVGVEIRAARIGAIWGPLGRTASRFFATPQLVHAAAHGVEPDPASLPGGRAPFADDGFDMFYVRDCGRALAALQLAGRLEHQVYNVAAGRVTTYGELADAIGAAVPGARPKLPEGNDPQLTLPQVRLDISKLREDTGFEPAYDTAGAVADYVAWLRAGHER